MMHGFDPRLHCCVVLDEPSRELVDACKVFLQTSVDGTEMYQSPTQRFTRWIWLYHTAIVVCTNEWVKSVEQDASARWIRENQVHVHVTAPLWQEPLEDDRVALGGA